MHLINYYYNVILPFIRSEIMQPFSCLSIRVLLMMHITNDVTVTAITTRYGKGNTNFLSNISSIYIIVIAVMPNPINIPSNIAVQIILKDSFTTTLLICYFYSPIALKMPNSHECSLIFDIIETHTTKNAIIMDTITIIT